MTHQEADKGVITYTVHPGDQIEWQRAGTVQHGAVDFLHWDEDGQQWAFCTIGETWTAVSLKFVKRVEA